MSKLDARISKLEDFLNAGPTELVFSPQEDGTYISPSGRILTRQQLDELGQRSKFPVLIWDLPPIQPAEPWKTP